MTGTPVTRILVYTDGEVIGDGILRLSFAAALKQAHPHAHLTWLASAYSVYSTSLAAMAQPLIDQLMILPDRSLPWRDYLFRPALLRHTQFDVVIDTQRNVKRTLWLKRLRHRQFISAAANGLLSSHKLPVLSPHFLTRLQQLGETALGQPLPLPPLTLPAPHYASEAAALLPETTTHYIGFIIGAGHPDKCWPLENFIELAQHVAAHGDIPVLFLGPNEHSHHATQQKTPPTARFPLQTTNAPSPYLTIALAARLHAAIANDSGGAHLLAAGGAPLVTLIRSNTVREKFLPHTPRVVALTPEDFNGTRMADIPYEAAQEALDALSRQ